MISPLMRCALRPAAKAAGWACGKADGKLRAALHAAACLQVQPPVITMRDFEKVLLRARPTVSSKDLKVFEEFTQEFGEEG